MLIGFAGPMGSGKTTAANLIPGAVVKSFATPLKKGVAEIFGFTDHQLYTMEGKNSIDEFWGVSPREVLQYIGTDCIRKYLPGFWVRRMELELKKIRGQRIVVIDDVRFNDEANLIRKLSGAVVHIVGRRAEVPEEVAKHKSEKGVELMLHDVTLDNSGTVYDLQKVVRRLLEYLGE